jgi:hypothetical protein
LLLLASFGISTSPLFNREKKIKRGLVTGIIYLVRVSQPDSSPWAISTFTLVYVSISFSVNILLTLMIVIRLYLLRKRTTNVLGPRHGVHYTSIIAILVESAALMDIMLLFFVIPFAMGNPLANIPLSAMVQVQVRANDFEIGIRA